MFRTSVMLCGGNGCTARGSLRIKEALEKELKERGLEKEIGVVLTGCNGFCAQGPIMIVHPEDIFYKKVTVQDVPAIVDEHLVKGRPVERLMYRDPQKKQAVPAMKDIPFFRLQVLRALRNKGMIDPERIEEYIGRDGYMAAAKALTEMTPQEIITEITRSGLRGRGGAGAVTGKKWEVCAGEKADQKYIVCNRSTLEIEPHSVIEGMIIAARAIGATKGYIYTRASLPLVAGRFTIAVEQAREYGLLGEDILESGFAFDIEVFPASDEFVCGEETALLMSIESKRGMPRPKPPFPAVQGLWEKPTVINTVETFANV
ncbi:MAG: NADH-quinone oxidoreductase subunit F, partial [Nitrospirales bacterium]|nr:NADH-quinone oxidoreductase subunit F [Nitrospirales bacterium]